MAIQIRRGKEEDLDFSKLKEAELALTTDTKKLFFCYSPGNVRRLQTAEELQNLLDASPEAYQALQQLIADLSANPNELANILSSISALESGKVSKTDLVQTDQVSNPEKVPSSTVTHALGQEIDTLNNNLASQSASRVYSSSNISCGLLINTGRKFGSNNHSLEVLRIWGISRGHAAPIDTMIHLTNGTNVFTYCYQYNRGYPLSEIKLFAISGDIYIYLPKLNTYSRYILECSDALYISNATWEENEPTIYDATFTATIM